MGFNDFWLKIVGILVITFFVPLVLFGVEHRNGGFISFLVASLVTLFHATVLWTGNKIIFYRTLSSYPIGKENKKFVTILCLRVIAYVLIVQMLGLWIESYFAPYEVNTNHEVKTIGISILITFAVLGLYFGIEVVQSYNDAIKEQEVLKRESSEAQFQALKSQMNPHFLFNSLNTLTGIIPEAPDLAVDYTENLAKVYRYILDIKDQKLISIKEEMKCVNAYIHMLKTRFEESMDFEFAIEEQHMNQYIIPLSIQTLIENAVKHNVSSKNRPLHIDVKIDNGRLKVCNNLQKVSRTYESSGIGLSNLNSRYLMLSDRSINIEETNNQFCVSIPVIKVNQYESNYS